MESLNRVYYDAAHPASYGGIGKLAKATGLPRKKVKQWLLGQRSYTLHKPLKKHFQRRRTVVAGIDHQWQADLSDLSSLSAVNDGYRYLLCVIDIFSKYAWVVPMKKKTGEALTKAFASIKKRQPLRLQTDKGTEFLNKQFQAYLKKRKIHFFVTHNVETKASVVERFQRTLKEKMWRYFTHRQTQRYIDVLPKLVRAYNASVHRTIKMAPKDVKPEDEWRLTPRYKEQKKRTFENPVRLALAKHGAFEKGYWPNWTMETFRVTPSLGEGYKLVDERGEALEGSFYPEELQTVRVDPDEIFPMTVLKRKGPNVLVQWHGYPKSFNSWIPRSAIV